MFLHAAAYSYSFEHRTGGGFIGGLLAWIFCPNFGLAGSYVIDAIMLIISLVLITERSALRGMQKGGKKVYESARSGNERHKERVRIQREEREQRRLRFCQELSLWESWTRSGLRG